jgi:ribosomal protein L31
MPKKGIHPLMRAVRIVMRDGGSYMVRSTLARAAPYVLTTDTTTHPAWTGEKAGLSLEDARIGRIAKRYEGFVDMGEGGAAAATAPAAAAAPPPAED